MCNANITGAEIAIRVGQIGNAVGINAPDSQIPAGETAQFKAGVLAAVNPDASSFAVFHINPGHAGNHVFFVEVHTAEFIESEGLGLAYLEARPHIETLSS